jgi:hypothetical protein
VTVEKSFTPESAAAIARLMVSAPQLGHAFKELAPLPMHSEADSEEVERFITAWKVLMDSAKRDPFNPVESSDEESLCREFNHPDVIGLNHHQRFEKYTARRKARKGKE